MSTYIKNAIFIIMSMVLCVSFSITSTNVIMAKECEEVIFSDQFIDLSKYEKFVEKYELESKKKKLEFNVTTGESSSQVLDNKVAQLRELLEGNENTEIVGDNLVDLTNQLNALKESTEDTTSDVDNTQQDIDGNQQDYTQLDETQPDNNVTGNPLEGIDYTEVTFEEFIEITK